MQALDELGMHDRGASDHAKGIDGLSSSDFAASIRESILAGKLSITSCMVLGIPLTPSGQLRPVTMPCCGFTASLAGAQQLADAGRCRFCKTPLPANATFDADPAVSQSILLEDRGYGPRVFTSDDVILGHKIGCGAEGTVYSGMLRARPIAVKRVRLPRVINAVETARLKEIIANTYAAGIASHNVCRLQGCCWTDSELWCAFDP